MKKRDIKIIAVLMVVIFICAGLYIRAKDRDDDEIEKEDTVVEVSNEVLSIETPAGAAIVGTIKNDDDGWYLEPEQTLNVHITMYEGITFEDVSRINLFSNQDGFNLDNYRDELVTVTGMLQDYRGSGQLYMYLITLDIGKTVDQCEALPNLDYPSDDTSEEYDPSIPLPEIMNPIIEEGHYVYNPYAISKNTLEKMGNDFTSFYIDFVNAFMNYETTISCPKQLYADFFTMVLNYEFPLFEADGKYDVITGYDSDKNTITWSYTSESKEEHDQLISNFEEKANEILKAVDPLDFDQKRAQDLYHTFTPLMTYDYDALETRLHTEAYYAYTLHSGVCVTFSTALNQLYTNIGIESNIVSADTTGPIGHEWNMITIDGKNYFCDVTYELTFENGTLYAYYGMTLDNRLSDGSLLKDTIRIGGMNYKSLSEVTISDTMLQIIAE